MENCCKTHTQSQWDTDSDSGSKDGDTTHVTWLGNLSGKLGGLPALLFLEWERCSHTSPSNWLSIGRQLNKKPTEYIALFSRIYFASLRHN